MNDTAPHINFSKIRHLLTDSRNLHDAEHTLFFCLEGKSRSGVDYIEELFHKGVRHFVVPSTYQSELNATFIRCSKPIEMLQYVSMYHNLSYEGNMLAITGSNGKTVVKEWLFQIMSKHRYTYRSPKSYNSQIGVPLSLWEVPQESKLAIIEAGISQPGEMLRLSNIIRPNYGIFTNIGNAHQENFSTLEEKTKEKLVLFTDTDSIVYSKDSLIVDRLIKETYPNKDLVAWSFVDQEADFYFALNKDHQLMILYIGGEKTMSYAFPFTDDASLENIAHAIVTAIHLGISPHDIDVSKMESVAMRLEHKQGIHGCSLINDAYNSDVLSLGIALDSLNRLAKSKKNKKTLFLSDIDQSGLPAMELYQIIADMVNDKKVDRLIAIGADISSFDHCFEIEDAHFFYTTADFLQYFDANDFKEESILFKGARRFQFEQIIRLLEERRHQTILEIDLSCLRENVNYFRSLLEPDTMIMGMVKAFAYGSGALAVARTLQQQGCNYLAVAVADEGIELRNYGITLPIVVMTPERNSFEVMIEYDLQPAIYSFNELNSFLKVAQQLDTNKYPVHIKFDTGMHRLGFQVCDIEELCKIFINQVQLHPISIFSHLAAADESQWDNFTRSQINTFTDIVGKVESCLGFKVIKHILNSAGTERFTDSQMDMVRLGIGMYGISCKQESLQQIATLKTSITQIRTITEEETVGYGRHGRVSTQSVIGTLPIGYADGLNRLLGNGNGYVLIKGEKAPFIGNICMDLCMIDLTNVEADEADEVILMGEDLPATILAEKMNTIPYEVLTSISQRVKRVYIE